MRTHTHTVNVLAAYLDDTNISNENSLWELDAIEMANRLHNTQRTQKEGDNVNKQSPRGFVRAKSNTHPTLILPTGRKCRDFRVKGDTKREREGDS
jgi:hypothetical protein